MSIRIHIPDTIADQIALAHSDTRATLAAIARRAEGASTEDLLLAALALLRDQAAQIAELETEVGERCDERDRVAEQIDELEAKLTELRRDLRALTQTEHAAP